MMKKVQKLLTLGLCLALGAGALVACDKDKGGSGDGYAEGDLTNYWMAGKIKGVDGWDEKDADNNNLVADAVRFVRSAESGVYTLTLDLWKDDQFKIRYLGRGWDDEGGQLNASNNFDEENNGDTTNGLAGESGDGLGGKNFECYNEGNYTVTIDTNSDTPMVTWVRNGDATVKAPILATDVTLKDADEQVVSSITLRVGETLQLSATVIPDTTTNKAVTYSSSNTDCFTVSATGLVTAVAVPEDDEEELELYVNVGSQIALKTVSVTILAAGAVIVQPESITIPAAQKTQNKLVGETVTITPEVLPADTTNKAVSYSVPQGTECVTITAGVIKAVKPGTATVTATVGTGANAKTDTFTVNVAQSLCLVGSSPSAAFEGVSWKTDYNGVAAVPTGILFTQDDADPTKYTLDVDLYAGSSIKIINVGIEAGWNDLTHIIGASADGVNLVNTATTDTDIESVDASTSKNIGVANDGKYRITVVIPATGEPTLTYKYLENAAALALTTDVRIKGDYNGWQATTLCKAGFNASQASTGTFTQTFKLKFTGESEKAFGLYTTITDADSQLSWARDQVNTNDPEAPTLTLCAGVTNGSGNWMISAGTYDVSVTVDFAGNFTNVTFAVATDDTGAIDITPPAVA